MEQDIFKNEIPTYIREILALHGITYNEILIVAPADLTIEGSYGESWAIATSTDLWVIIVDSKEVVYKELAIAYPIQSITKLKNERMAIGGILVACFAEEEQILLRYTNSCSRDIAGFTKGFEKIKEGKFSEQDTGDQKEELINCPTCGNRYEDPVRKICPKCFDKRAIFLRVLSYLPRYKIQISLILLCMLLSSVLNMFLPYLSGNIFYDEVLKKEGKYYGRLGLFILLMFGVKLLATGIGVVYGRINSALTAQVIFDLKTEIFEALQKLSLNFYSNKQTGTLMNNINDDAMRLQYFFHDGVPYFIVNAMTMIGIFGIMLALHWPLALLSIFPIPFIVYALKKLFPRLWVLFSRMFRRNSSMNSLISDSLEGSRVVKAFGREEAEVDRFGTVNQQVFQVNVELRNTTQTVFPILHFFMGTSGLIIWGVGSWLVVIGNITFGSLISFTGYVGMLMGPLQFMTEITNWWSDCMNSASRIFEIMDAVPQVQEKADPIRLPKMQGEVELQGVTFGYEPNQPVLKDINLSVKPGEMIGIVGHSGAGKSTLTNIITRLYDVEEGIVTIDGIPIQDLSMKDLHKQIGLVLQETYLFMGTVAENIAYAKPDATEEEIMKAAKIANAHDFIMKLPDAYNTMIGAKGQGLSGGEKQRLSIARAVLLNPKILILDEATASLDTETEKLIQEALEKLVQGRTTFSIAHRLSTLRNADRLVVLDKGEIKEIGTHEELIEKEDIYYQLVEKQKEALELRGVS